MRCVVLFGFILSLTLASPIMNLTMNIGYKETYENDYRKHTHVKARGEKYQPQHAEKVQLEKRRESSTNNVADAQAKNNETMSNKTKEVATEIFSANLKSLKHFHKRNAEFSSDHYLSEPVDSAIFPYLDYVSEEKVNVNSDDTSEQSDSDSLNEFSSTVSSEFNNAAGSSESSNPTESKTSDDLSISEEFTYNYDTKETASIRSDSNEPDIQHSSFSTPNDDSENSNEFRDFSTKANIELSSESQSASSSSELNDKSDCSKSNSSSDPNTSSDSSDTMTVTTTDKIN
ncbi:uncharacterized protein ACMZJ9_023026 [Mantella aurantiaca]